MKDNLITAFMILTAMLLTGGLVAYATAAESVPVAQTEAAATEVPEDVAAEAFVSHMIDLQHRRSLDSNR